MDFPDAIGSKPSRPAHARPADRSAPPLLKPLPQPDGALSAEHELVKQTKLLIFIAGWVLASSLLLVMSLTFALVIGGIYLFFNNPMMLVFATFGLVLLLLLTLVGVSGLRRIVFNTIKLRV